MRMQDFFRNVMWMITMMAEIRYLFYVDVFYFVFERLTVFSVCPVMNYSWNSDIVMACSCSCPCLFIAHLHVTNTNRAQGA